MYRGDDTGRHGARGYRDEGRFNEARDMEEGEWGGSDVRERREPQRGWRRERDQGRDGGRHGAREGDREREGAR